MTTVSISFAVPANVRVPPVLKVSVPVPPAIVKLDDDGEENESVPLPFVVRICPFVPSAPGRVKVTIPARVPGALIVTKSVPLLLHSTKFTPLPVVVVFLVQYR